MKKQMSNLPWQPPRNQLISNSIHILDQNQINHFIFIGIGKVLTDREQDKEGYFERIRVYTCSQLGYSTKFTIFTKMVNSIFFSFL